MYMYVQFWQQDLIWFTGDYISTKKRKNSDESSKKKPAACDQSPISGILIKKLSKPKHRAAAETSEDGKAVTSATTPPEAKRGDIDSK